MMNMMEQTLIRLLNIHGVSGQEFKVRKWLKFALKDLVDTITIDEHGNLLGEKKVGTGDGATIMLSAHMDTVRGVSKDKLVINKSGIITAELPDGSRGILGADDRAGIAIILTVLRNIPKSFNGVIKVAFSRQEEIGCVGAEKIPKSFYQDVDLAIVVDRRGNRDIVVGCDMAFCCDDVGIFMEHVSEVADMDWKCVEGGISDAMTFANNGINSINLSAGYHNEHTNSEFVSIFNMKDTVKLILQSLALINKFYVFFGEVPQSNAWVKGSTFFMYEDEFMWEEVDDDNGVVYAHMIDEDLLIQQGTETIRISPENFKKLFEKVNKSLVNRV